MKLSEELIKVARDILAVRITKTNWLSVPEFLKLLDSDFIKEQNPDNGSEFEESSYYKKKLKDIVVRYPRAKVKYELIPEAARVGRMFSSHILFKGLTEPQIVGPQSIVKNNLVSTIITPEGDRYIVSRLDGKAYLRHSPTSSSEWETTPQELIKRYGAENLVLRAEWK